jgi:L-threonylcarbamoyladenylate synthase
MISPVAKLLPAHDCALAVEALRLGNIVGMPTETVYGLAGNAFDADAVAKIFSAKERPSFDPLIVHIADDLNSVTKLGSANIIAPESMTPSMIRITDALIQKFWPGPLTIILPKNPKIPDLVTSGLDQVGVRMPAHEVAQKLLKACGLPLAAPSANRFGRISPTTALHVAEELGTKIPYIVDGGSCAIGIESTVITVDNDCVWLLRPGIISVLELAACAGVPVKSALAVHEKASPGMLASHYAPKKTMYIVEDWSQFPEGLPTDARTKSMAILVTSGDGVNEKNHLAAHKIKPVVTLLLTPNGLDTEAAKGLFAAMRELDKSSAEIIVASSTPSSDGLWFAIKDRMHRASAKH